MTTRNKPFRQSSLDTLLQNRVYLGYYRAMGEEIADGVPKIIDRELFDRVQERKAHNRLAPPSFKATEEYLLTTKFFCGKCGSMMIGENGKGHCGGKYYYYKCGNHKRNEGCKQRILRKEIAEKLVIDRIIELIHRKGVIEGVAECACRIQKQESTLLPILNANLKEVEKGIDNMLNAIQMGIITESTKARLDSLEEEKKKIQTAILNEKLEHPDIPKEFFEDWLTRLKSGSKDDPKYRKLITDVFLNAVYLTDEGLTFGLNFIEGGETIPLRDWNEAVGSDTLGYAPSQKPVSNDWLLHAFVTDNGLVASLPYCISESKPLCSAVYTLVEGV